MAVWITGYISEENPVNQEVINCVVQLNYLSYSNDRSCSQAIEYIKDVSQELYGPSRLYSSSPELLMEVLDALSQHFKRLERRTTHQKENKR